MIKLPIIVITRDSSDLLSLMHSWDLPVTVITPEEITSKDLSASQAIAILGGTSEQPLLLTPEQRVRVEEQIGLGKKVFAEYTVSIGHIYTELPQTTRFKRLVFCSDQVEVSGLSVGMLLDDQCGMRIRPHSITCVHSKPILQFTTIHAHDQIEVPDDFYNEISDRALWFDNPSNLLACSFRLSNFIQARYAPKERMASIVQFILNWLFSTDKTIEALPYVYTNGSYDESQDLDGQVAQSVDQAMAWLSQPAILNEAGRSGIMEGYGNDIFGDGSQKLNAIRRVDCIGEAALSYFMYHQYNQESRYSVISDSLQNYMFDYYVCREEGPLYGMMRWTNEAWGVCYQDDVARAVIPVLLKSLYTGSTNGLNDVYAALQFLVNTTGSDGTRVFRTDNKDLTPEKLASLKNNPGNLPSAHYNAFYYAALCLAYRIGGNKAFLEAAIKGMDAILATYPETKREQSETQEYSRLIMPLSFIYGVTGDVKYKEWLYRVTQDLQRFKHESGAYLEWDTGLKASMRHAVGEGESSLLAKNGDPVVDLLYSNNWLPMGFIQAYFVTEDEYFLNLWRENAAFMLRSQIHSSDTAINGAWARAFDVKLGEVYGSPADAGWGPWCIESGWTVAEIASGLLMGLLREDLIKHHRVIKVEA